MRTQTNNKPRKLSTEIRANLPSITGYGAAILDIVSGDPFDKLSKIYMGLTNSGMSDGAAYALAFAGSGTTLVMAGAVGMGVGKVAQSATDYGAVYRDAVETALPAARAFFTRERIKQSDRRAIAIDSDVFTRVIQEASDRAGVRYATVGRCKDITVMAANGKEIDPIIDALTASTLGKKLKLDKMVICSAACGTTAPAAMRRLNDGSSLAVWADKDGNPLTVAGYRADGGPSFAYDVRTRTTNKNPSYLDMIPRPVEAAFQMKGVAEQSAAIYEEQRRAVYESPAPQTHTITETAGHIFVFNREGRLDNPYGNAAHIEPDGHAHYYANGNKLEKFAAQGYAQDHEYRNAEAASVPETDGGVSYAGML